MAKIPDMIVTVEVEPAFVGLARIAAERRRQVVEELFSAAHDAAHAAGELICAAICYAEVARLQGLGLPFHAARRSGFIVRTWPWELEWFKPAEDLARNLEKAGALIAAEIDRLAALPAPPAIDSS